MSTEIKTNTFARTRTKQSKKTRNPFPGLRPFGMDESHLFFGREGQSDEVLHKLSENKFVAVIGSSGSGKSSFMYCGVIPILYGGFLTNVATNWDIVVARPGGGPIDNMAEAILKKEKDYDSIDSNEKVLRKTIIATLLRSSSLGLVEAVSRFTDTKNTNVLLIVDQFEELFRFKKTEESNGSSESLAFVNLLVEAIQSIDVPIYVAITMRSDFIGECAQFPSLTKLINNSNYLIPQMTREQKRAAISGPISVGGAKIAPRLMQQLLSDLGDNPDQLPILAHSLMRTWDYWAEHHDEGESIDLPHYEAIGMMSGALSQHANEAYDELNTRQKDICAVIFKCLTEKSGDTDGIRRPTKVSVMSNIANCTDDEIFNIVEVFRKPGRSLLSPPVGVTLNSNTIIDISHESLMRIWIRLKNWVDEEGQAVEMYLRLSDASAKYQTGKAGLWRPPDLQLALNWQEKNTPTLDWAQRYNPAFERTMVFLETSKKAFETEQRVKEEMQRTRLRNSRRMNLFLGILAMLAVVALVYSYMQKIDADKAKLEALVQKEKAEIQSKEARKNSKIAQEQTLIAKEKEKEAIKQSEEAKHQAQLAKEAADEANRQKALAQRSLMIATQQTKLAQEQKALALVSEHKAIEQQIKAEKASNDALKQRMLSIAQAMAVKSLQIYDTTTKSLVAQQAYVFNRDYEGNPHNHDIYDGLYYAVKSLYHDTYNSLKGHTDAVRSVAFTTEGKTMFTAGSDGKILKWVRQGEKFTSISFYNNNYINKSLIISPNNKWMAVIGEAPYIQLFNLADPNAKPKKLFGHKGQAWSIAFTPDNQSLISTGADSSVLLRSLDSDKYYLLAKTGAKVKSLAVSPKGTIVVGGDENGQLHVWDMKGSRNEILLHAKNFKKVHAMAFSGDGKFLVAGDEHGSVKMWNMDESNKLVANLIGHRARINDIKFGLKNNVLATASFDGSVRLWNIEDLSEQPIVLRDHNSWVWSVAFTPDGENIVTGCVDNLIRIYPTDITTMANKVCTKLARNMTPDEWSLYVAKDIAYKETCKGLPVGKNQELE